MFDSGPFDRHCREKCTISPWYEIPPGYLPGELTAYLPCLLTLFNLLGKPISRLTSLRPRLLTNLRSLRFTIAVCNETQEA